MSITRREFGKLTLAGMPAALAWRSLPVSARAARAAIDSKVKGVQIGAITYSFRTMADPNEIIRAFVTIGLGEMELMSGDCEKLAGAPSAGRGGRGAQTPEQQAAAKALSEWRLSATESTFKPVRQKIEDAGIHLGVLCYNMSTAMSDDLIDYAFTMAKGLGVSAISSSTTVSMAKRLAPFAEKHKLIVGFHNHDNTEDPDQMATEASFKAVLATSKYLGANFDIGHYVSANGDPVAFIKHYHGRITNVHIKDRRRNHAGPIVWGQGDVPIKEVLQLISQNKWSFPVNIEYVYDDPDGAIAGVTKCYQFIKAALA
jgi:sugar phosphate isomerase/epimerase